MLDTVRWFGTPEPTPHLPTVASAVFSDRRIRMRYSRRGTSTRRTLDPLGLVLAAGDWYLVATHGGHDRTYRISRITSATILDEPLRRPRGFDLASVWSQRRREMETQHPPTDVTVRVRTSALPRLRRSVAVTGQHLIDPAATGDWITLTVPFDSANWAKTVLLGLGSDVVVDAPADVRDAVAGELAAAAHHYELQ